MRKSFGILIVLSFVCLQAMSQSTSLVKLMKWGLDYTIRLELSNDSIYVLNVKDLYQAGDTAANAYYPVNFSKELIDKASQTTMEDKEDYNSLFRAIHTVTGGGWAHFINCMLYSFESGKLSLTSAEMTRPVTDWKPNPITESYTRTKNWKYYVPFEFKNAKKELKIRKKKNQLTELEGVPAQFIELSMQTNDKAYAALVASGDLATKAKIDFVRLMLGANYLGKDQVKYISQSVMLAIKEYSIYELPTVIVFKNFNAAVAMTLANSGYRIEGIVFSDAETIGADMIATRTKEIERIIQDINQANQKAIEKKLKRFYAE